MSGLQWSRRTTRKIAAERATLGISVSKNWAGEPLTSWEKILYCISTTTTKAGLTASAYPVPGNYVTVVKVSDEVMRQLCLVKHHRLPLWNYTLSPARNVN